MSNITIIMEGLSDQFMIDFFRGKTGETREQFMREVIGRLIRPYPGVTYDQIVEILPPNDKRDLEDTVDNLKDALIGANNMIRYEPNKKNFTSIEHEFVSYEDLRVYRCLGLAYNIITEEEGEELFTRLIEDDE